MVSINDVARASGVSVSTVSRALRGIGTISEETRAKIRATADELGYIPSSVASGLVTGKAMSMTVVVPTIRRWFYMCVLQGIEEALRPAGYDMVVLNLGGPTGARERVFHRALLRQRADAMITLAFSTTEAEGEQLRALHVPAVAVGGRVAALRSIGIDDHRAATLAMTHLLDLGHTRVAHVGGDDALGLDPYVPLVRQQVWHDLLAERVGSATERWFAPGGFTIDGGFSAGLHLLRDPVDRPTAVYAGSDEMAFGVLMAAARLGIRVPDELSVVGIDDHDHAAVFGLTTVHQDPVAQGRRGAQLLIDELAGHPVPQESQFAPCDLVTRTTTAPPLVR